MRSGQANTAREACTATTAAAARAAGASDDLGRAAPGCLADLAAFAANPLDLDPEAQPADAVLATAAGGAVQLHRTRAEGNP